MSTAVRDFGYGPLTDAFLTVSMERLVTPEALAAWTIWNRVFAAHRRMFGENLDMQTSDGRWI